MLKVKKVLQVTASTVLFSCALAAGNAIAAQSQNFTANLNTTETLIPGSPLCSWQSAGVGAGSGTSDLFAKKPSTDPVPVGMTSTDCVQPTFDPAVLGGTAPAILTFSNGYLIMAGPGGDSITATYTTGTLRTSNDPSSITPNGIVYTFTPAAHFIITGGTGRFAKASGSGDISGYEIVNFATGTSVGKLLATGTINY
jgi:hypothetical protein